MSTVHKDGKVVSEGDSSKEQVAFSLRLPALLASQIEARRMISKRSRNKEIEMMLERQIEAEVEKDRLLIEKMAAMNIT